MRAKKRLRSKYNNHRKLLTIKTSTRKQMFSNEVIISGTRTGSYPNYVYYYTYTNAKA